MDLAAAKKAIWAENSKQAQIGLVQSLIGNVERKIEHLRGQMSGRGSARVEDRRDLAALQAELDRLRGELGELEASSTGAQASTGETG